MPRLPGGAYFLSHSMYLRRAYLAAGPLAAPPRLTLAPTGLAAFHADAPFVHRLAVGNALVAGTGHGQPGIGKTPAQIRRLLAVVVVAEDGFAVDLADMLGEELGNVLIGRPVDRYAQFIAVDFLELFLKSSGV
jgi:hypothetical protein